MLGHRHATIAVLAVTAAGLGGGVALAASTGSLPIAAGDHPHTSTTTRAPATSTAPTAGAAVDDATPTSAPGTSNGAGPDATGPAKFGLCTAYSSGNGVTEGNKADSTAFQALATAAGGAANIPSFCADATPGGGAPPSSTPSGGAENGQGTEHSSNTPATNGPPPAAGNSEEGRSHRP